MTPATAETFALEADYATASKVLKSLSGGGPFGLTPNSMKQSSAWIEAKSAYDKAFVSLRRHNQERLKGNAI